MSRSPATAPPSSSPFSPPSSSAASPMFPLWSVVGGVLPASCLAHLVYARLLSSPPDLEVVLTALLLWGIAEALFWMAMRWVLYPRLEALQPPAPNHQSPIETIRTVLRVAGEVEDYYPFPLFLQKWFKGTPMSDLRWENVRELLAWAGFNKLPGQLTTDEAADLQSLMEEEVPKLWRAQPLLPGHNPSANSPIRMTLEPMQFYHRPLAAVLAMKLLQMGGAALLTLWGFTRYESNGVGYWFRDGPRSRLPLFFFHGISPGMSVYLLFVALCGAGRPCVLFETPHIAMSMQAFSPTPKPKLLQAVRDVAKAHSMTKICVGGQSFGSIHAGWVMEGCPELVAQALFLDPVNFLLCCPDVAYNFLYREPEPSSLMHHVIYYLAAREVTVANTLRRHFWWYENLSHLSSAHCPVVIGLAQADEVAPASVLQRYIQAHQKTHHQPIELVWWEGYSHAQCLVVPWALRDLDQAMRRQEEDMAPQQRGLHAPDAAGGLSSDPTLLAPPSSSSSSTRALLQRLLWAAY